MDFYGELYVRSTDPLIPEERTQQEVGYLGWAFNTLAVAGPIVDLGCGTGRHAPRVAALTRRTVLGLELDPYALQHRYPGVTAVRADLRALPLQPRSIAGAYAWYSSLAHFDREEMVSVLRSVAGALKEGGALVLHTALLERRLAEPHSSFEHVFEDGTQLSETTVFDPKTQREEIRRTLNLADGRVLKGTLVLNYYAADVLVKLVESAGFQVMGTHGGLDLSPLDPTSVDMILAAKVRNG